nr:putative zinc-binding metallopeptidase [Prevotella sp.]
MKNIYLMIFAFTISCGFASCSDDDLSSESIFPTTAPTRDSLDEWVLKNYTYPYNVEFKYKMEDIESDKTYNLVPADSAKSAKLAIVAKYLWFDAYSECVGTDFVKANVPRMIHLIGSPAYNNNGTMVLGTAEGGYKVTLYMVNSLTDAMFANYATLNEYYFHTMHHEFTHILTQKKPYDKSFDLITESSYVSGDWYQQSASVAHKSGFITPYSMDEPNEDIAEMMSVYVTDTPEQWQAVLDDAGTTGAALITKKLEFLRAYMEDSWGLDIDKLRSIVNRRANGILSLDLEHLN